MIIYKGATRRFEQLVLARVSPGPLFIYAPLYA